MESFDIYVAGMEMGTNYSEQNDPEELRKAWLAEKKKAKEGKAEIKDRKTGKSEDLSLQDVLATLKEKCRIDRL